MTRTPIGASSRATFCVRLMTAAFDAEYAITRDNGVCDVTHTEELFRALDAELLLSRPVPPQEMFEGVDLLRTLIRNIVATN